MTIHVIRGDALHLPLHDGTVDLIVTSPPYFALRDYSTGHEMEVGSEHSPQAYLEALWAATAEMKRVLKPTGSIWINLGDTFARPGGGADVNPRSLPGAGRGTTARCPSPANPGVREKSLIGLPWRYAIGCIDQLGLILRRDLIWSKPNSLPESVRDRPRSSHEYWFLLVKEPRYYAALDEIREPHSPNSHARRRDGQLTPKQRAWVASQPINNGQEGLGRGLDANHPGGKLPGSVWTIPSEPLRLPPWIDTQHYAAFPTRWPEQLIKAFSPPGICVVCGQGRFPVVECARAPRRPSGYGRIGSSFEAAGGPKGARHDIGHVLTQASILGYACGCTPHTDHPGTGERHRNSGPTGNHRVTAITERPSNLDHGTPVGPWREYHLDKWTSPPTRPATVLDPFGGTGCTAHVAHALGRVGISVDLSDPYCHVAADTTLARQRAGKVAGRIHLERQGTLL